MFAQIVDGVIESGTVGPLPFSARRQDTFEVVHDLPGTGRHWRRACGWFEVVEVDPPTVEPGETVDLSVEVVDHLPTQVWTVRPKTADELQADVRTGNRSVLLDPVAAESAIDANQAWRDSTRAAQVLALEGDLTGNLLRNIVQDLIRQSQRQARQLNSLWRLALAATSPALLDELDPPDA